MKKKLLLPLTLIAGASMVISVACLASKGKPFNLFNRINDTLTRNNAFEVDHTTATEIDTDTYSAVASDNKGNSVTTKFVGFTHDSGGFKMTANKNMYFTNTQPMRGISDIHFSIDVANDYEPNFAYAVYGSSNPLVFDDIFNGYYSNDLEFYFNHFYDAHVDDFDYASYVEHSHAPSLENCHYVMVVLCNITSDVLPIETISFTATCADEPATKTNVQATAYKEATEMASAGIPDYFPYLNTNGYTYSLEIDFGLQLGMLNKPDNLNPLMMAAYMNGYEPIDMSAVQPNLVLYQKQTGATTALSIYLMYEMFNSELMYCAVVYSEAIPYQGAPSYDSWPTQAIEDLSTEALSLAFPAVTLTNAKYRVYERPDNGLYKAVYVEIQTEDNATTVSEFAAYADGLDTSIYSVINDYNTHYEIVSLDGRFSMTGYVSSYMELELIEYTQFDHFPVEEINTASNNSIKLPSDIEIDGTYMSDLSMIKATFNGTNDLSNLLSAFANDEYIYQGNDNAGCILPYLVENKEFAHCALQYQKVGTNQYEFSFVSAGVGENAEFSEAVEQLMNDPFGALDPLTYTEKVTYVAFEQGVSFKYIYIPYASSSVMQDIYDSINVPSSDKSYNTSANSVSYIYEYETDRYIVIRLVFEVVSGGVYVFPEFEEKGHDSTFTDLANDSIVINQLTIDGSYLDVPAGNRYVKTSGFSLCYISDYLDAYRQGMLYRASLLAEGYTCIDEYNGQYKGPTGYADVKIYFESNRGGVTILHISFYDYSSFIKGYENYEAAFENHEQSVDVLAMLALFPDVFEKDASKNIYTSVYYLTDKDMTLSFTVDSNGFVAGSIGQRLMREFGYHKKYNSQIWSYSLAFSKVDNEGNEYEISFYPTKSPAYCQYGDAFSVSLRYTPKD